MMLTAFFRDDCTISAIPSESSTDDSKLPRMVLRFEQGFENVAMYLTEKQAHKLLETVEIALIQITQNRSKPS